MPIDLSVIGKEMEPLEYTYTVRDTILYALGVGAGSEPDELKFIYENELTALPTFGVIPPFPALLGLASMEGVDINLLNLLHGEQYLEVQKQPIPVEGKLISKPKISAVYDKGKNALIELDSVTVNEKNETVFFNRFGVIIRGEGDFGGEKGPDMGNEPPDREPDKVAEMKTLPQQSLIYRLSGDYNPLHADPNFAAMAGFDRPILHGLCSFGFAGRAVLREYAGNEPSLFKSIKARFSRAVFPGDTIVTEMWKESDEKIIFRCRTPERGQFCLTNGVVYLNV